MSLKILQINYKFHVPAAELGGEASVATNGFWSSLTIATTLNLPMVFYIEDNGYGISVPASFWPSISVDIGGSTQR